jgi:hypothetical protein
MPKNNYSLSVTCNLLIYLWVCMSGCPCVSVYVSMFTLAQGLELEQLQVTRSGAGECIDRDCVSCPTGSHMARMLRQHQALIHLTGTCSHQSVSRLLMMSQPWLLQACWMSHQTVLPS